MNIYTVETNYDKIYEKELWEANKVDWAKLQLHKARKWAEEHPEIISLAVIVAPTVCKIGMSEYRTHRADVRIKKELDAKERRFYDRSINAYYITKRTPTTKQKQEIARRKRNGEHYDEILANMGLL